MMQCTILLVAGALAFAPALIGCKKEEKTQGEAAAGDPSGKTTEPVPAPPEPAPPATPAAPTAEAKVQFYQGCTAAFNAKDWERFGACYTENTETSFVDQADGELTNRADMLEGARAMGSAFPDLSLTPQVILQNGDRIAAILFMHGTHTQPLKATGGELPPTGKKIGLYTLHLVQLAPDKLEISKSSQVMDEASLAGQLGLHEGPHRPASESGFAATPVIVLSQPDSAAEKQNLELSNQATAAFEKRDVAAMLAGWADDVRITDMAMPGETSKKEAVVFLKDFFKGFPDARSEVEQWAAGDYVVSVSRNTGTNKGPMPSMKIRKPTGKAVSFTRASILRLDDGKVVEGWSFWNSMALASQLAP